MDALVRFLWETYSPTMRRLILFLLIEWFACRFAGATDTDWRIIAGQRIGRISIGMERAAVLRLLGAPEREDDLEYLAANDGGGAPFKNTLRDDWITPVPISGRPAELGGVFMANFVTVYFTDRRVAQIEVRLPRFKTADGLSSASTGIEWQKRFPHYKESFHKFPHTSAGGFPATKRFIDFDDDVEDGIAWRKAAMGDLAPDPSAEERVETVAVHAPGKPMIIDPDGGSRFIWKEHPRRLSTDR